MLIVTPGILRSPVLIALVILAEGGQLKFFEHQ